MKPVARFATICTILALTAVSTACKRAVRVESSSPLLHSPTLLNPARGHLRNTASMQEIHFTTPANNGAYASDTRSLRGYEPREGVVLKIIEGTQNGWAAVAYPTAMPSVGCVFVVGEVNRMPAAPGGTVAAKSGVVTCDPQTAAR